MLSRIADSLFWLNRYMERSDGLLRNIRTHYTLSLDKGLNDHLTWKPVLEIFTQHTSEEIDQLKDNNDQLLYHLLLDKDNANSLKMLILRARENARGVQDHITKEVWKQVNELYHLVNGLNPDHHLRGVETMETIDLLSRQCLLYNGVTDTTMPRGTGWNFMTIGRQIERCLMTIEISNKYFEMIDYNIEADNDILQWRPLLLSLSGYELHLKNYQSSNYNRNTLHQVLFNENFTRSVLYTLKRIDRDFNEITLYDNSTEVEALSKQFGRLISKLKYTDFDSLNKTTLQHFLGDSRKELSDFSRNLAKHFFSYT